MTVLRFCGLTATSFVLTFVYLDGFPAAGQSKDQATAVQTKKSDHHDHKKMFQECAKACSDCQRACDSCNIHCLHQLRAGKQEHLPSLLTCQDCATICASASEIVARGGPFSKAICEACVVACDQCAKECEKFPDDEHMKECAQECRKCEKACREMLKHFAA